MTKDLMATAQPYHIDPGKFPRSLPIVFIEGDGWLWRISSARGDSMNPCHLANSTSSSNSELKFWN